MEFAAHYSDGRTAARHDVSVALTPAGLRIGAGETGPSLLWPYADLHLIETEGRNAPVRLTWGEDGEARLVVADPEFLEALLVHAPGLNPRRRHRRRTAAIVAGSAGGVALLALTLWFGLPLLARPLAALVPASFEDRLGRQVATYIVGGQRICDDSSGAQALDRMVQEVLNGVERPLGVDVQVIDSPVVNAVAAPGGYIVVFSGLLQDAQNPDELAGVLAHEIAHVVHHHGTQAMIRYFAMSFVMTLVSGNDWGLGGLAAGAGQLLVQGAHSRSAESEADATAVRVLQKAGLRADGLATFFARLEKKDHAQSGVWRYLGTHPPTAERRAALATDQAGQSALTPDEWTALKSICRK